MRSTQQFSVTLPNEMADMVRSKVASGDYASESEVIREGLRALQAREQAVEEWLRTEVVASYDEMKAHPERGRTVDDVRERLKRLHLERTKSGT
jgi:putative addiction module CopG family antidote